jgi:alkaline phosphatase
MMAKAAINQLENSDGYFILIEASLIDISGHYRDIAAAMGEMDDLAKTVEFLEGYVANHPDTLVVMAADHSTGGLSLGRKTGQDINKDINSLFVWQPQILRDMNIAPRGFSKKFAQENLNIQQVNAILNFTLSTDEMASLEQAKQQGVKRLKDFEKLSTEQQKKQSRPAVFKPILVTIKNIIDVKTNTGWGSISNLGTHTAVDVQVFSFGSNSEKFAGFQDNTDIGKKVFTLLGNKK